MLNFTREDVARYAAKCFPSEDITVVMSLLDEYGLQDYERERERVQMGILFLSRGTLDGLLHNIEQAKLDYRNILYWAEYDEQDNRRMPYQL